jgi:hypothetical protein
MGSNWLFLPDINRAVSVENATQRDVSAKIIII